MVVLRGPCSRLAGKVSGAARRPLAPAPGTCARTAGNKVTRWKSEIISGSKGVTVRGGAGHTDAILRKNEELERPTLQLRMRNIDMRRAYKSACDIVRAVSPSQRSRG